MTRKLRPLTLEFLERRDVPSFAALPAYLAGASPVAIAGADVNEDGLHDIVTANRTTPGMVSVLLNQGGGSFDLPKSFPSGGSNPSSLAIADFNNNGRLDIAVTNQSSGTVSILRGSGTGVFRRPQSYPAGPSPTAIDVSDFNADGAPDIVVVNSSTTTISVLINNGDGTFAAPVSHNLGTKALAVTTGDFNNDGNNDFIASGHNLTCPNWCEPINSRVTLFLGHGDGTFSNGWTFTALSSPGAITVADFDFDNKLDLVSIDTHADDKYPGKNVNVFFGNGDGTFHNPLFYVIGSTPSRVDIGDTDDDGLLDIVVLKPPGPIQNVVILRGTIDGLFHPPQWHDGGVKPADISIADYTADGATDIGIVNSVGGIGSVTLMVANGAGGFPTSLPKYGPATDYITVADFTGEGHLDFARTSSTTNGVGVYSGSATGSFESTGTFSADGKERHLLAEDFDADGITDLAVATDPPIFGNISVAIGTQDAQLFQQAKTFPAPSYAQNLVAADLNGDGNLDMVQGTGTSSGSGQKTLYLYFGMGNGALANPVSLHTGAEAWSAAVGDFNDDGIPDLVTGSKLMRGNGDGTFRAPVNHGAKGCYIDVGDFNDDGAQDLATAECEPWPYNQTGAVWIVLGNGNGTFKPATKITGNSHPKGIIVSDINNDGRADLVDWGTFYPIAPVNVRLGNGDGTFLPPLVLDNFGDYLADVDVGDLNGDGNVDLVACTYENYVKVLFGNGDGSFQGFINVPLAMWAFHSTIGDLDNDGDLDIAVARPNGGNPVPADDLAILFNNGDGTFLSGGNYANIADPNHIISADLDGDGRLDLIVSEDDYSQAQMHVFLNTPNATFVGVRANEVNADPGALAAGDFNGDAFPDLAIPHTTGFGGVTVLLGNGTGFFAPPAIYNFGVIARAVTVTDVNGDGIFDLASVDANGYANILLGNGDGTFQYAGSYPAGDGVWALAAADFDLDGDADLVVANNLPAGAISFLFNNGDGTFQEPLGLGVGASPQHLVTGDFNNDGRPDVAVANFGGGIVSVMLGNGDGEFQTPLHFAVADSLRWLAAADVNNDGFTDLLVTSANGVAVLLNAADWPPLPIGDGPSAPVDIGRQTMSAKPNVVARPILVHGDLKTAETVASPGPKFVSRQIARVVRPPVDVLATELT